MASTFPPTVDGFSPEPPVDNFNDVMASDVGRLQEAIVATQTFLTKVSLSAQFKNVEILSADKTLTDADYLIQRLDCDGANRNVNAPLAAAGNHAFWIVNSSAGAYTITFKSNDGITTYGTITQSQRKLFMPDGNGAYAEIADIAVAINKATAKTTPVDADRFGFWDSVSGLLNHVTWANIKAVSAETTTTIGALINGATNKTTPVDADYIGLMDSAASNILKKLSWANIKITLFTAIGGLTGKTTPVDADTLVISDSAASGVGKSLTWANLKATLLSNLPIEAGTFVPTYPTSNPTPINVAAITGEVCNYIRILDRVIVAGRTLIDPTTGATQTTQGMTFPIASNITLATDVEGVCNAQLFTESGIISGDVTNDVALIDFMCVSTTNHRLWFVYMYTIK